MRIYFDPITRKALYTFEAGNTDAMPAGDFVEHDGPLPGPLGAVIVAEDGSLSVPDLTLSQDVAIEQINALADGVRRRFITVIAGQEMIYKEKEAEAIRYVAESPEPATLDSYPFIAAEVGITAPTAYQVAQLYLNAAARWRQIGSELENARLGAIIAVETATTTTEIEQTKAGMEAAAAAILAQT